MSLTRKSKIINSFWLSCRKSLFLYAPLFVVLLVPSITNAGIISFLSSVLSGQSASAEVESSISSSSDDSSVLVPAIALDPIAKQAGDITIVGNEALLPEVGPSTLAPDKSETSNGKISVYIVRSGDTLSGIAEMYDVSVNTILWANDLSKGSAIRVGQTLVILPMSGVMHSVVSGDTLQTIAKKYGGDVEEIALFNDLKVTDKIAVGDTIMIPDGEMSFSTRPSVSTSQSSKIVSASGPDLGGYYQKPFLVGRKTQGIHGYNGVDYGMPIGTQIYAAAQGTVIISKNSGYNGGYGSYIVIQHPNNTQTVYGHLSSTVASVGQSVSQGQLIGYSGNTGKSTGPHLHFEVRGAKNPL